MVCPIPQQKENDSTPFANAKSTFINDSADNTLLNKTATRRPMNKHLSGHIFSQETIKTEGRIDERKATKAYNIGFNMSRGNPNSRLGQTKCDDAVSVDW
mgnify:CR=1 FL=1